MRVLDGRLVIDQVTRDWRKLRKERVHDLYFSPDILRDIKSRRIRWKIWHVWKNVRTENLKERDNFEDLGVDGRIIFSWILHK
jgi:hypothetical protein